MQLPFESDRTMTVGPQIVNIAALIGEHARAEVLTALLAGRAMTATELAHRAHVTKQTMSSHLGKLVGAQLLVMERQGRHRYFRLANADVAHMLETIMGVADRSGAVPLNTSPREPALRKARRCYDHLAGALGVSVFDGLMRRQALRLDPSGLQLSAAGEALFAEFGVDVAGLKAGRRVMCRTCLDWSERRHHLAGALGAALLDRLVALGWAQLSRESRIVEFSVSGERRLLAALG